jgi:predicted phosphate transport protein (TIGR00153 family)
LPCMIVNARFRHLCRPEEGAGMTSMYGLLFRKQNQIVELIREFVEQAMLAKDNFNRAMDLYFATGKCCPDFDFLVEQTHEAEARSDDVKEKIERLLHEKGLIPEFRADVVDILDHVDDVPDQFDRVLYAIQTQNISLPPAFVPDFKNLVSVSVDACELMRDCVECLLQADKDVAAIRRSIDQCENQGDHIERRAIMRIFQSEIPAIEKVLLKDLVMLIGDIADYTKEVGRRIYILSIKRRV